MKVRLPLYLQTLCFLLVHLTALLLLLLFFFNTQFGMGWEALLNSPLGDRVETIAWVVHEQIRARPRQSWNEVLEQFGKLYGVKFYLFDRNGDEVAGEPLVLPDVVRARLVHPHGRLIGRALAPYGSGQAVPPQMVPIAPPPPAPPLAPNSRRDRPMRGRFLVHTRNPGCFWIGTRLGIPQPGSIPPFAFGTLLATAPNLWQTRLFFELNTLLCLVAAVLGFSIVLWWPFVRQITRALEQLTSVTERIAQGRFDTRLNVNGPDELKRLSDAVNSMAERLEAFVAGQKRFLGDTAHELCSPVSRLQVALELLEASGTPEQEIVIKDIRDDVYEMSNLINELLAFSKAGLQGKDIQLGAVDLKEILDRAVFKAGAEKLCTVECPAKMFVLGDQLLLERAFGNVLRNAVRYAGSEEPIDLKVQHSSAEVVVTIRDRGPGVPAEAIKLLGQPFFRPEPSRSRDSGGVGLGLAIVKTCVEACEGSFTVRNCQPRGLEVEVRLQHRLGAPAQTEKQKPVESRLGSL